MVPILCLGDCIAVLTDNISCMLMEGFAVEATVVPTEALATVGLHLLLDPPCCLELDLFNRVSMCLV